MNINLEVVWYYVFFVVFDMDFLNIDDILFF